MPRLYQRPAQRQWLSLAHPQTSHQGIDWHWPCYTPEGLRPRVSATLGGCCYVSETCRGRVHYCPSCGLPYCATHAHGHVAGGAERSVAAWPTIPTRRFREAAQRIRRTWGAPWDDLIAYAGHGASHRPATLRDARKGRRYPVRADATQQWQAMDQFLHDRRAAAKKMAASPNPGKG